MAAIYRFGFEGSSVPEGVTVDPYDSGYLSISGIVGPGTSETTVYRGPGTVQDWFTARYGSMGARTRVACQLQNENAVKGSFELFIGGSTIFPMLLISIGNTEFRLKNANTIEIQTNGIPNAELTVPTIGAYNWYEVRFCYVAGATGMAIFEWDGNELTFDADPGQPLRGNLTIIELGKSMPTRFAIDNVALNNEKGGVDDDIPPMTVSYYTSATDPGDSWDNPELAWETNGASPVYALNHGGIYANSPGKVANFRFNFETPTDQPFVKVSLEGLRLIYGSIRRTGVILDYGVQVGYRVRGENVPVQTINRINYSGVSSKFVMLYGPNGEKLTVEDGENLQSYIEIVEL